MFRHRLLASGTILLLATSCVSLKEQGDKSAARGRWKEAVKFYSKAEEENPSQEGLQQAKRSAIKQGVEESFALSERCAVEEDFVCMEKEMSWVLSVDKTNKEAAEFRANARKEITKTTLQNAESAAGRGDFVDAAKLLTKARSLAREDELIKRADDIAALAAPGALEFASVALAGLEQKPADDRISISSDIILVLTSFGGDQSAKALLEAQQVLKVATEEKRAAARKQAKERRAAEAKAAADRDRSVALIGVVVAPTRQGGNGWDVGGSTQSVQDLASEALSNPDPQLGFALFAAKAVGMTVSAPDVYGSVEFFYNGKRLGKQPTPLRERPDSYYPVWDPNITWTHIDLDRARMRGTLYDSDRPFSSDDPIGVVEITGKDLKKASGADGIFAVKVNDQGNGQILYVALSVF